MARLASTTLFGAALLLASQAALADESDAAPKTQTWTVTFDDGTATLSASTPTETKFVQGTITALQQSGLERIVLRKGPAPRSSAERPSLTISLSSNEAELSATPEVEAKHVTPLVSMLAENDISKIKLAVPKEGK